MGVAFLAQNSCLIDRGEMCEADLGADRVDPVLTSWTFKIQLTTVHNSQK